MTMGARIKQRRELADLTQSELAAMLGVGAQGTISEWEHNKAVPETPNVIAMCRHFHVSADWLIFGRGSVEPSEPGELERKLSLIRRILDAPPDEWERLWPKG